MGTCNLIKRHPVINTGSLDLQPGAKIFGTAFGKFNHLTQQNYRNDPELYLSF